MRCHTGRVWSLFARRAWWKTRNECRNEANTIDAGFTLVELIISVSFVAVISILALAVFMNSLNVQKTVVSGTQSATKAQVVEQSISKAVRSAIQVRVSSDGTRLDVQDSDGWHSWAVETGDSLQLRSAGTTTAVAASDLSTAPWVNAVALETPTDASFEYFTASGSDTCIVTYNFTAASDTDDSQTTVISGQATSRNEVSTCGS